MGTYAVYRLWAGITTDEIEIEHPFLDKVIEAMDPVKESGLDFTSIAMHGETIGIGVEIKELDWGRRSAPQISMMPIFRQKQRRFCDV